MLRKADRCPSCRGKGRKLLLLRRSDARGGNASERALLRRSWVACLKCSGTGRAQLCRQTTLRNARQRNSSAHIRERRFPSGGYALIWPRSLTGARSLTM